jgi:hypothetical protein
MLILFISQSKSCYNWRSVGQPVLVSDTYLGLMTRFYYCQAVADLLKCGILSDKRTDLYGVPHQRSHSRVLVPQDSWLYFKSWTRDSSSLEGQVPVFMSPRSRVAQTYLQALDSLSITSYESHGYGGFHMGYFWLYWLTIVTSVYMYQLEYHMNVPDNRICCTNVVK